MDRLTLLALDINQTTTSLHWNRFFYFEVYPKDNQIATTADDTLVMDLQIQLILIDNEISVAKSIWKT